MTKLGPGKKMVDSDIAISSGRTVLTLSEAAALLACSVDDLIHKGARGELRICARAPEDTVVYSTNKGLIDLSDPTLTGIQRKLREDHAIDLLALAAPEIQMVVLRSADCGLAIAQGEVYQSHFTAGVRIEATGIPIVVKPLAPEGAGGMDIAPFRVFACYPNTLDPNDWSTRKTFAPLRLVLTIDAMRILRPDLGPLEFNSNEPTCFEIDFVEEAYMPRALVKLYEVAMAHWDCSRPGWTAPEAGSVERALQELETYKGKLAKNAAILLRRSFLNWTQSHYERRKANGKLMPFDALVVVASAWKTMDDSAADGNNAVAKYRDKATAFEFWESCGIKKYLADYAWQIASPESARKTGRPRSK